MAVMNGVQAYIPYSRAVVKQRLFADPLLADDAERLGHVAEMMEAIWHHRNHGDAERLKAAYEPMDPDQTNDPDYGAIPEFLATFDEVLTDGNWEEISQEELDDAMEGEDVFPISLDVRFDEFAHMALYKLGLQTVHDTRKSLFGLKEEPIQTETYDRVIQVIQFKDEAWFIENKREKHYPGPGARGLHLRMFKTVPKLDLETIFPNTKPKMKVIDQAKIGIPLIGGVASLAAKFGPLLLGLLTFGALGGGSGADLNTSILTGVVVALAGYIYKTYAGYRKTKDAYMSQVSKDLYFKAQANNTAVLQMVVDLSEEQEVKEALLAYAFLRRRQLEDTTELYTLSQLDDDIEAWIVEQDEDVLVDFEVDDAIAKLAELGLLVREAGRDGEFEADEALDVVDPAEALRCMDEHWDNLYTYAEDAREELTRGERVGAAVEGATDRVKEAVEDATESVKESVAEAAAGAKGAAGKAKQAAERAKGKAATAAAGLKKKLKRDDDDDDGESED